MEFRQRKNLKQNFQIKLWCNGPGQDEKGFRGVRLNNQKVLCSPGLRTK